VNLEPVLQCQCREAGRGSNRAKGRLHHGLVSVLAQLAAVTRQANGRATSLQDSHAISASRLMMSITVFLLKPTFRPIRR
jgi:hypothetical protein